MPERDHSTVTGWIGAHSEIAVDRYNYVWNSDGLRSVEFSTKPEIIALGCSITLGQGLPIEHTWVDILSKKLNKPIGNISYSGASAAKDVSSFFGLIHKYNYIPKVVIANFANMQRLYFIDPMNEYMRDYFLNNEPRISKALVPFEYGQIIPYEWVYYQNFDHIKMLEAFCKVNNILLIWSSWSTNMPDNMEDFINATFDNYVSDPTRGEFPDNFEYSVDVKSPVELPNMFKMYNWDSMQCHLTEFDEEPEAFHHGYDFHKIAGEWGPGAYWPHPGRHRHIHWADFYYEELKKRDYIRS